MKNKSFIFVFLMFCLCSCGCGGKSLPLPVPTEVAEELPTEVILAESKPGAVPELPIKKLDLLSGSVNASGAYVYIVGRIGIFLNVAGEKLRLYSDEKGDLYGHYWTTDQKPYFILSPGSMEEGIAIPLEVPDPSGSPLKIGFIARQKGLWFFLVMHD